MRTILALCLLAAAAAPARARSLENELLDRLVVDETKPEWTAAVREAVSLMLKSPTGRDLTRDFLTLGTTVQVVFGPFDETHYFVDGSSKPTPGRRAVTTYDRSCKITMSEVLLGPARVELPGTMAHELLGHARSTIRARQAGLLNNLSFDEDDEISALLVTGVVELEAGVPLSDALQPALLAEGTTTYRERMAFSSIGPARGMSAAELLSPADSLRARLAELDRRIAHNALRRREMDIWYFWFDHWVAVHGADPRALADLRRVVDLKYDELRNDAHDYERTRPDLVVLVDMMSGEGGEAWSEQIRAAAASPASTRMREDSRRLLARFRKLYRAPPDEPEPSPSTSSVKALTWDDAQDLIAGEKAEHPDHAALAPAPLSEATPNPVFDPSLVEGEVTRPTDLRAPYLARFEKDGRVLWYAGARHAEARSGPTMRLIRRAFEKGAPEFVVIEGVMSSLGPDDPGYKRYALESCTEKSCFGGEPAYAASLAMERGVSFAGGEPSDARLLADMKKSGYDARDLFAFFFLRRFPQNRFEGVLREDRLPELYRDCFRNHPVLKPEEFPFEEFERWYAEKNGKPFDLKTFKDEELAPRSSGPYFTQKVSAAVDLTRNRFVVRLLEQLLVAHREVLIVYGASHFLMERAALEAALGKPYFAPVETKTAAAGMAKRPRQMPARTVEVDGYKKSVP